MEKRGKLDINKYGDKRIIKQWEEKPQDRLRDTSPP